MSADHDVADFFVSDASQQYDAGLAGGSVDELLGKRVQRLL